MANSDGVSTTQGWPTKFLFLKKYLRSNVGKRYILTLLTISKGIKPKGKEWLTIQPDLSTIFGETKELRKNVIPRFFIDVIKRKYKLEGTLEAPSRRNLFLNMRGSPTGPSIMTSVESSIAHGYDQMQNLLTLLGDSFDAIYLKAYNWAFKNITKKVRSGALAIVHDSEGKERVIAMLDYWSQWALKPIHDKLLLYLKRIPSDRTFSQDPYHTWKNDKELFWSLDLSAATDRFPIYVQEKLIKAVFGDKIGEAWSALLIRRNYWYKGNPYKYSVGQPMGAYSSWAAFALTHHVVVQWAAYKAGYRNFNDYILLGDDIVIKNNRVAQIYIAMMQRWGVDISKAKTHVSKHTYEFAKRWIHHGEEISPLPCKGLLNHWKEPKTSLSILWDYCYKSNFFPIKSVYDIIKESSKRLVINKQYVTNCLFAKRCEDFWIALRYVHDNLSPNELNNYLIRKEIIKDPISKDEAYLLLSRILNIGMGKVVSKVNISIINFYDKLFKEFYPEVKDRNELYWHPVIASLSNILLDIDERLVQYKGTSQDLKSLAEYLTIPGVNDIIHLNRNIRKRVISIEKVWARSFDHYKSVKDFLWFDDNANLGYTNWLKVVSNSVKETSRDLETWSSGGYKEKSTTNILDAWANFKL